MRVCRVGLAEVVGNSEKRSAWERDLRVHAADAAAKDDVDEVESCDVDDGSQGGDAGGAAIQDGGRVLDDVFGNVGGVGALDIFLLKKLVHEGVEELALFLHADVVAGTVGLCSWNCARSGHSGENGKEKADEEKLLDGDHFRMWS